MRLASCCCFNPSSGITSVLTRAVNALVRATALFQSLKRDNERSDSAVVAWPTSVSGFQSLKRDNERSDVDDRGLGQHVETFQSLKRDNERSDGYIVWEAECARICFNPSSGITSVLTPGSSGMRQSSPAVSIPQAG